MTSLTLILIAIMIAAAISGHGYARAIAIAGGTPAGAALVLGGVAMPTFYFAALGAIVGLILRLLDRTKRFERVSGPMFGGAVPLLLFAVWSIFATLTASLLFPGLETFASDGEVRGLVPGQLTSSNIAQIVYLAIGLAVVFYLARAKEVGPELIGLASSVITLLCFWRFISLYTPLPFPEWFFDNSPNFNYIEAAPGGESRFRGIFPEPSALASSSLVTVAYSLSRAVRVTGTRRVAILFVGAVAALMAALSTSATFVVASVAMAALAGLAFLVHFLVRRGGLSSFAVAAGCVAALAGLWLLPLIANTIESTVNEKVGSSSYDIRAGSDDRSYEIFAETLGFGVGLGGHRPSSFFASLLSTTGLIGTVLFVAAVIILVRRALPIDRYRPVLWALAALMVSKVISGPDLADPTGIMWLALGVLAHAGQHAPRADALTYEPGVVPTASPRGDRRPPAPKVVLPG